MYYAGYPLILMKKELTNRIGNKMIRPTTVPQSLEELVIEQAIAREALRLSFIQHKSFAVNLKGVQKERTISDAFEQTDSGESLVDMMELDLMIGSGGVLSHAPRREQSARMLIDSFLPEGITPVSSGFHFYDAPARCHGKYRKGRFGQRCPKRQLLKYLKKIA